MCGIIIRFKHGRKGVDRVMVIPYYNDMVFSFGTQSRCTPYIHRYITSATDQALEEFKHVDVLLGKTL